MNPIHRPPPLPPFPVHYSFGARELLGILWRRKGYLVAALLTSVALGAVYFLRAEHTYEVKARLLVERQDLHLAPADREKPDKDAEFLATQAEILKSPAVISKAAADVDWPVPSDRISPADAMIAALTVRPVMGTNVLSVGFQASSPERAASAVMAIVESYRRYLSQNERDNHLQILELLTRNEKELRQDLQVLQDDYAQLRKTSPLGGKGKGGVDVHMALVEELGRQLAEARNQRIQLENQLQIVDRGRQDAEQIAEVTTSGIHFSYASANPLSPIDAAPTELPLGKLGNQEALPPDSPIAKDIAAIQQQLLEAQLREQDLAARFGHKHPDLRAVRDQIANLILEQQKLVDSAPEILRNQLAAANANEVRLAEMYASELDTAKSIDLYLLEETQAVERINRVRALHDSIVDQVRQWKLTNEAAASGRSHIRVTLLEHPSIPLKPVWPEPFLLLGVCGAIGLVAGGGLIAMVECRASTTRVTLTEAARGDPELLIPGIEAVTSTNTNALAANSNANVLAGS